MRRIVKRKTKAIVFSILFIISFLVVSFFSVKLFVILRGHTFFKSTQFFQEDKIISPKIESFEIQKIRSKIEEMNIQINSFEISSKTAVLTLRVKNGPIVLFSDSKDINEQLSSLQLIMRRLTIDGGSLKPSKIDLRFRNPIVTF